MPSDPSADPARHPALRVHGARRHRPRRDHASSTSTSSAWSSPRRTRTRSTCARSRSSSTTTSCCAQGPVAAVAAFALPGAHAPRTSTAPRPTTSRWDAAPSAARRFRQRDRRLGPGRGSARLPLRVLLRRRRTSSASPGATTSTAPGALVRLDHFNQVTPDVPRGPRSTSKTWASASPRTSRTRTASLTPRGCGAKTPSTTPRSPAATGRECTTSPSPPTRNTTSSTSATSSVRCVESDMIERGPGRHGVSNAFYLYIRDPDGHRVEIYTQDYYTGDPDNPRRELGRARQPATGLVGQPRGSELVHRGLARARPRRHPAARPGAHRAERDGGDHRCRRLLLHPPRRQAQGFKLGNTL